MPSQDPRGLGSLEECRNRRLIGSLAGVVEEVVVTQMGLVRAVGQLERRSRPPGARRFRPRASLANVLVFALVFGALFTLGSGALPEGPMPAAEAETSRPPHKAAPSTTTAAPPGPSRPQPRRGMLQQPAMTPTTSSLPVAAAATVTSQPVTTMTLPAEVVTSTTLSVLPPLTTLPCEGKGCGDED